MQPETAEWVEIAEEDFATASREQAVADRSDFAAACFHAQQSAEKYLKAVLVEQNIHFPRRITLSWWRDRQTAHQQAAKIREMAAPGLHSICCPGPKRNREAVAHERPENAGASLYQRTVTS